MIKSDIARVTATLNRFGFAMKPRRWRASNFKWAVSLRTVDKMTTLNSCPCKSSVEPTVTPEIFFASRCFIIFSFCL